MLVIKNVNIDDVAVAMLANLASVKLENDTAIFKFVGNVDRESIEIRIPVSMRHIKNYEKFMERVYHYFDNLDDNNVFTYSTLLQIVDDSVAYVNK